MSICYFKTVKARPFSKGQQTYSCLNVKMHVQEDIQLGILKDVEAVSSSRNKIQVPT